MHHHPNLLLALHDERQARLERDAARYALTQALRRRRRRRRRRLRRVTALTPAFLRYACR